MNRSSNTVTRAALFRQWLLGCLLGLGLFASPMLQAADAAAAGPDAGKRFGTVWKIRGEVAVTGTSGASRNLKEGDPILVGERVRAAANAEAVLRTEDAGMVAIRPSAEFVAERFSAEGKPTDNFTVRIITGSLRVITGWIGRINRADHKIVTPSATIGIRGTDHEPYVLPADQAAATASKEGTYDKVNRGGTTMIVGDNKLDIDSGRVGFVRSDQKPYKTRALMTILLPVLLDKVPAFYVPGEFDAELDKLSQSIDEDSQKQLDLKRKASAAAPVAASCSPQALAKGWLAQLDSAIVKGDAGKIMSLFASEVSVRANVRNKDGTMATVELGREELAQSTVAAVKGLKGYKQRRISIEARAGDAGPSAGCSRLEVKSVVIEQGRQSGKPYRFESTEEYVLERREDRWLAVKAETTQR